MKRTLTLILLLGVCLCVRALSVVTLRNGQVVRGDVVVHNEEVLIIKNNEGARFQYPASEVVSVEEVEEEVHPLPQPGIPEIGGWGGCDLQSTGVTLLRGSPGHRGTQTTCPRW